MGTVIARNTLIPNKRSCTFTTSTDNQEKFEVKVFEGERIFTKDNIPIGNFELVGIPPAPRGVPEIEGKLL